MAPPQSDLPARSLIATSSRRSAIRTAVAALAAGRVGDASGARGRSPAPRQIGARTLIGYYVGYERDLMPPDEIEWDTMTHIAVGAALPRGNGSLDLSFYLGPGEGPPFAADLAARATANGVVPLLMLGGAGSRGVFRAATRRRRRRKFVAAVVAALDRLGFAGVDLDWEPLATSDAKPFLGLVRALRAALPNAVLTAPLGPTTLTFPTVPAVWARAAPLLDRVNLMTYGMEGPYPGWQSWHSSALDGATATTPSSVAVAVTNALAAGIPAAKLGVGVGFYGDCWTSPVTGPGEDLDGAQIAATDSEMSYIRIVDEFLTPAAERFDPVAQVPFLTFATPQGVPGCRYITYEDAASITAKGQWARDRGLGGAIVWTVNQGHDRSAPAGQRDALMRATRQAFGA